MATTAPARTDTTGGAVARRIDPDTPAGFRQQLKQNADKITLPQGISLEAFENVVFSATVQNPDLLKADRQSLLLACLKAAQDGLLPNGRDAALVVFSTSVKEGGNWVSKKLVQYMPMVAGLRSKIWRAVNPKDGTPVVSSLKVNVVYKVEYDNGFFVWEPGSVPEIQHRPMLELTAEEAADENIVCAYSIAKFHDGTESVEVMRRFEIDKVRQVSQTGAVGKTVRFGNDAGKPIPPKGPWVDWFPEMAKKTVLRRHSKVLPMAGDIVSFEANDEAADFKAADNTSNLLASQQPDAPEQLEDRRDETDADAESNRIADEAGADRETGEITDPGKAGAAVAEATGKEHKPRARSRAEPEKVPDAAKALEKAEKAIATADAALAKHGSESAEGKESADSSNGPAETAATTQGATESGASAGSNTSSTVGQAKAEELLQMFKRTENVIDLERHKRELDKHREALEPAHVELLDAAYETASERLYGRRSQ